MAKEYKSEAIDRMQILSPMTALDHTAWIMVSITHTIIQRSSPDEHELCGSMTQTAS
ncbi:MAG: hypothetical protein ACO3PR_00635 [Limisphaerales bacterium]